MDRRRSVVVLLCVLLLVGTLVVGGAGAATRAPRERGEGDFLTAAGHLLGPAPGTLRSPSLQGDDEKIHFNAKITCEGPEQGDHLHIHAKDVQFRAAAITGGCSGEDDEGQASGTAMGFCNGSPATADFFFSTSDPDPDPPPGRQPTHTEPVELSVQGGCTIEAAGEPRGGGVKFHDKTPEEPTTAG